MRDFRELKVWQAGHQLVLDLYQTTSAFPKAELYGLTSQIRRAALSVCANIAEGSGRLTNKEMRQFLVIAQGSAAEIQYLLLIGTELGYLERGAGEALDGRVQDLRRMLNGFIRKLSPKKLTANG